MFSRRASIYFSATNSELPGKGFQISCLRCAMSKYIYPNISKRLNWSDAQTRFPGIVSKCPETWGLAKKTPLGKNPGSFTMLPHPDEDDDSQEEDDDSQDDDSKEEEKCDVLRKESQKPRKPPGEAQKRPHKGANSFDGGRPSRYATSMHVIKEAKKRYRSDELTEVDPSRIVLHGTDGMTSRKLHQ
jgi:hypothetical protein